MSESFNLDPVSRITAGAVGEPGSRIFFIQARKDDVLVTLLVEKQQVHVLASTLTQLLESMGVDPDPAAALDMDLENPLLPEWRIGPMAIEVEEETGLFVFLAEEAVPPGDDDDDDDDEDAVAIEGARARFVATRAQMRALADHAEAVVSAGRPRCQLCGFPIDPDGHTCPATNGHRAIET